MSTYATLNIVNRSARAARLGQWTVVRVVGRDDEMQCGGPTRSGRLDGGALYLFLAFMNRSVRRGCAPLGGRGGRH
jgi:hypothetical protein